MRKIILCLLLFMLPNVCLAKDLLVLGADWCPACVKLKQYLASNGDLITAFGNDTSAATQHYVNNGYSESRSTDSFDATNYLTNNGDLIAAFGSDTAAATQHYVNHGYSEGRII